MDSTAEIERDETVAKNRESELTRLAIKAAHLRGDITKLQAVGAPAEHIRKAQAAFDAASAKLDEFAAR